MRFTMTAVAAMALITSSMSTDAFLSKTSSATAFYRSKSSCRAQQSASSSSSTVIVVTEVPTKPIPGMKPGTSGLRKKVEVWQAVDPENEHYVENFIQSLLDTATAKNNGQVPQTYVQFFLPFGWSHSPAPVPCVTLVSLRPFRPHPRF